MDIKSEIALALRELRRIIPGFLRGGVFFFCSLAAALLYVLVLALAENHVGKAGGLVAWTLAFALDTLFMLWVLRWGGARVLTNFWAGLFFLGAFIAANSLDSEHIKLYVLLAWVLHLFWFVGGLFVPTLRMASA